VKKAIQILLAVIILVLGYLIFESIMTPIRFKKERQHREEATIKRLKDIRIAQIAFKSEYERFTGDFDSLIEVMGKPEAEKIALGQGLIERDTIQLSVIDSLFYAGYPVDSIRFVSFTTGQEFELGAGELETGSKVRVKVFEAMVPYSILLEGLDPQLIASYTEERERITGYPGLKVGSVDEATNNAGNWE
jgi:hypothetical protein